MIFTLPLHSSLDMQGKNGQNCNPTLLNHHFIQLKLEQLKITWYAWKKIAKLPNFSATGCNDLNPPPHAWTERHYNITTIGCINNDFTWKVKCIGSKWVGYQGNCTQKAGIFSLLWWQLLITSFEGYLPKSVVLWVWKIILYYILLYYILLLYLYKKRRKENCLKVTNKQFSA